ncbi:NPC intracellular cholesterol transporter 2-like [Culex pipiens pallens]|uniref:NPC intracellular cholesterol transporter 2-like n=1 Tax=Culex pipiens pallens TaxID=42434 RepID=UPI001954983E|nr:NPC intracellular cholesterol transporter 2-like [Culex pipiens pallens]
MFRYAVLIALVLPALALAGDVVETRACSDDRPVPREVRVQNCPSTPCELVRGSDANMEMDFTAPFNAATLQTRIVATALGVTAPFELPADRARACDWLIGSQCPISEQEDVTYNLQMPVLRIYPRVSLVLEVSLVDEEERTHACFVLDARVVGA